MKVIDYFYKVPDTASLRVTDDRETYCNAQYTELAADFVKGIRLNGKVAFLYAGGVTLPASECRHTKDNGKYRDNLVDSGLVIRELSAYMMHKWIGMFEGKKHIEYASINANTCASSMHSLYEASKLLDDGFDEVIIVGEEKTRYNTLRLFDEMGINIPISEGMFILHLGKASTPAEEVITDCKWSYEYNKNPFGTTSSGYQKVFTDCDIVKPHGTGTENNEIAEQTVIGDLPQIRLKEQIGHSQGVSGLLELCMVLDIDIVGNVLCVSSGLGGFYGSCILHKR